jgi:hypothetical protein
MCVESDEETFLGTRIWRVVLNGETIAAYETRAQAKAAIAKAKLKISHLGEGTDTVARPRAGDRRPKT